jgi:hypothetical protein
MPPDAILRTLRHVWLALKPLDIPMAVMGGIALATWKYVRATRDIDLLIGAVEADPARLVESLQAVGIRPIRLPATRLGQLELIQAIYEPPGAFVDIHIDLLWAGSDYHCQALDRRVTVRLPDLDIEVAVLACEDLILHKLLAERMIDRVDVVALLRANRESLDFAYLLDWTRKLNVGPALAEAWKNAWPNEPPPV